MKLKHDNAMTITRLRNDLSYDDAMVRLHPCFQTRPIYRNIHIDLSVYKSMYTLVCSYKVPYASFLVDFYVYR